MAREVERAIEAADASSRRRQCRRATTTRRPRKPSKRTTTSTLVDHQAYHRAAGRPFLAPDHIASKTRKEEQAGRHKAQRQQ